jgi:hypothetical protein
VKFREPAGLPPHQDRRLQLRMLGFVGLIALAMFAWQAWRLSSEPVAPDRALLRLPLDEEDSAEPNPPLKEDEFRMTASDEGDVADDDGATDSSNAPPSARIPAGWLSEVQDNIVGIRRRESAAYYRILAQARNVPVREMEAAADPNASYANLMASPARFRGRPVRLAGDVRNLFAYEAPPNEFGVTQLYDAWILTTDSGNQPFRVVCLSIPADLQPGTNLNRQVQVVGYFFKKEAYETQAGAMNVAPTLLAGRLEFYAPPEAMPDVEEAAPWLIAVIVVVGLAMLATVIGFAISDSRRRLRPAVPEQISSADAQLLSQAAENRISVEESLRRLENDEPLESPVAEPPADGNGDSATAHLPDELLDLPTPLPPNRDRPKFS